MKNRSCRILNNQNRSIKTLSILTLLLVLGSCNETDEFEELGVVREFTTLDQDMKLESLYQGITSLGSRTDGDVVDRADWNNVYKIQDSENNRTAYTVPVYPETSSSFENIVFVSYNGTDGGVIFRYTPDSEWFDNHYSPEGMVVYTGLIEVLSLSGELMISSYYQNGVRVELENVRVSECETWIDVVWTVVTAGGESYITEMSWTEYELCDDPSGGGPLPLGPGPKPGPDGPGGGGTPTPIGTLLPDKCPEGALISKDGCICEFGEDANGVCIIIDLNIDEDDQGPNACELALIVQYPSQALAINNNVSKANTKTQQLFGFYDNNGNGFNDCADAFRHAYFNMLNTLSVGANITRQFGEAHECDSESDNQTDMDLYNNEVGINLTLFNPQVSESDLINFLLEKLYNGELKILSNLGSKNTETDQTTVISSESCKN